MVSRKLLVAAGVVFAIAVAAVAIVTIRRHKTIYIGARGAARGPRSRGRDRDPQRGPAGHRRAERAAAASTGTSSR